MAIILLTSAGSDKAPCLVNWNQVSLAVEKFQNNEFTCTKIYLIEGGVSYVQVLETVQQIHEKLRVAQA